MLAEQEFPGTGDEVAVPHCRSDSRMTTPMRRKFFETSNSGLMLDICSVMWDV